MKIKYYSFNAVYSKIFGIVDKESDNYKIGHSELNKPLDTNFTEFLIPATERKIQVSKLTNGITVVTETPSIPSDINMGILLNVGAREENDFTSGSLLSFKNTYYKSILNTNETINFGMVQMSGGKYNMDYNQENTYYSARCLPHDAYDIFEMMSDCVFEPKNSITANVGIYKNEYSHNKENQFDSGIKYSNHIMKVAYRESKIANPIIGNKSNILNLNASTLQKFQIENISPEKVIIGATGVFNHNEFKDIVNEKLGHLSKIDTNKRDTTVYYGGEIRIPNDTYSTELTLCFKGASWKDKDLLPLKLLDLIYGESNVEDIRESGELIVSKFDENVFTKNTFLDFISLCNMNFSDTGLFGIRVKGDSSKNIELLNIAIEQMKNLKNITQSDLNHAKKLFKINYLKGLNTNENRLEEILKNFSTYNNFAYNEIINQLDNLKLQDVKNAVDNLFKSNLTFVAEGGNVSSLPSFDSIKSKFQSK